MYTSGPCYDLCNIYLPIDQSGRKDLWPANCTGVKIALWSSSNTAEISLKYLTCCNKLGANSYICSLCSSLLYKMFFENISRCFTSCKIFSFSSYSNQTLYYFLSKPKGGLHPPTCVRFGSTLKPARNQTVFLARLPPQAPPHLLNEKLCQWSSSCSVGPTVLLSWLAGEAASHRQSRSLGSQWERRRVRVDRHIVAKTTTFEWVCSWNAARRQLYNRLRGGVRLGRGSDKGSNGERDFFFHCPLFIYILQLQFVGQQEFYPTKTLR